MAQPRIIPFDSKPVKAPPADVRIDPALVEVMAEAIEDSWIDEIVEAILAEERRLMERPDNWSAMSRDERRTYLEAAWFMAHRLRYAMESGSIVLSGTVEVDEGYVGGKRKSGKGRMPADGGRKAAVAVLVQRGGKVKAMPMQRVDGDSMASAIKEHVAPGSVLMTDETNIYHGPKVPSGKRTIAGMPRHMVNHGTGEYVRGDVHTNTAEGFISLLKRGVVGTFHHVGKGHLGRYVSEFEFRYNARKVADKDRPVLIVAGAEGKRLTYKQPSGARTH